MARHLKRRGPGKRGLLQAHEQRLADARTLYRADRWSGGIYMAGYVVECLLKASILARKGLKTLPEVFWRHDLYGLAAAAGLLPGLMSDPDPAPKAGLTLLADLWSVSMRYEGKTGDPTKARNILKAVEVLRRWLLERI